MQTKMFLYCQDFKIIFKNRIVFSGACCMEKTCNYQTLESKIYTVPQNSFMTEFLRCQFIALAFQTQ